MKKNRKKIIILLSLFVVVSICVGYKEYQIYKKEKKENEIIDQFIENQKEEVITKKEETKEIHIEPEYDYIAVLEIPSIGLRKGIVDVDSKYNDVNYNIEIINPSQMPNISNGNLILASHSGSLDVSFFRNLNKLNKGDSAIIYYENVKYTYEVNNIENEDKNGSITIKKSNNKNTLTLTTCNPNDETKQIVVICNLIRADRL